MTNTLGIGSCFAMHCRPFNNAKMLNQPNEMSYSPKLSDVEAKGASAGAGAHSLSHRHTDRERDGGKKGRVGTVTQKGQEGWRHKKGRMAENRNGDVHVTDH